MYLWTLAVSQRECKYCQQLSALHLVSAPSWVRDPRRSCWCLHDFQPLLLAFVSVTSLPRVLQGPRWQISGSNGAQKSNEPANGAKSTSFWGVELEKKAQKVPVIRCSPTSHQ